MEQGKIMVYRVVYLAKTYNIAPHLLVNIDQTRLHVVPIVRERSWEGRRTKQIQVLSVEDKRQLTIVASLTVMVICFLFKWYLQELEDDNYHLTMHEKQSALYMDGI
jgi:hypothetical protein